MVCLCEQLVKFVAVGEIWKKVLVVGDVFLFKEEKLLGTMALPRQESGPHSLSVTAELPFFLLQHHGVYSHN